MNHKLKTEQLIRIIYQETCYSHAGCKAINELCEYGVVGLDAMISSWKNPPKTEAHPRDVWDTFFSYFYAYARSYSDNLIERLENGTLECGYVYYALGNAKGRHSIDVLIEGLKASNQYDRCMAVESLIRRKSKRSVPVLTEKLKDRSSSVKGSVVFSMKKWKWLRTPAALPLLKRIRESKSMKQHSLGTWRCSGEVIDLIEKEQ